MCVHWWVQDFSFETLGFFRCGRCGVVSHDRVSVCPDCSPEVI